MTDLLNSLIQEVRVGLCEYCQKDFTKQRADQRFCSDTCRNRHHVENRKRKSYGPLVDSEGNLTWAARQWAYDTMTGSRRRIYKLIHETLGMSFEDIRKLELSNVKEERF